MALRTDLRARTARAGRLLALAAVLVTVSEAQAATPVTPATNPTPKTTIVKTTTTSTTAATTTTARPLAATAHPGTPAAHPFATTPAKGAWTTPATKPLSKTAAKPAPLPHRVNLFPPVMLAANASKVAPVVAMKPAPATTTAREASHGSYATTGQIATATMPLTVVKAKPMPNVVSGRSSSAQLTAHASPAPTMAHTNVAQATPHPGTSPAKTNLATVTTGAHASPVTTGAHATTVTTAPSFSARMARTTVTPPVAASSAKAMLVPAAHPASPGTGPVTAPHTASAATAHGNTTTAPVSGRLAQATPAPLAHKIASPALALFTNAKPSWTFRQVKAGASTSAGMHPQALAVRTSGAKPVVIAHAAIPAKATATAPAPKVAVVTTGHSTAAAKVTTVTITGKALAAKAMPGKGVALATGPHPTKPMVMSTSVQTLGARFMEQREQYVYDSLNRRDPFASLVSGSFETEVGTPLLDVSSMKLVGIVWGSSDKFALVEDGHGHGFVLRVGDPVLNGYIAGLTKEELIVKQSSYGDAQTVTIQLQRKEGASNGN